MLTSPQEQGYQGEDHLVTKVFAEEEHPQHDLDRDYPEHGHRIFYNLQDFSKLLDVGRVLLDQLTREDVCPEAVLALAERDLEFDLFGLVAVPTKEVERMSEDRRASLHSIVEP